MGQGVTDPRSRLHGGRIIASIYVLPTEEGRPPRAVVGEQAIDGFVGLPVQYVHDDDRWIWEANGQPVPDDLGEAITSHARWLGVPTFVDE